MSAITDELISSINKLSDDDKLHLVDEILTNLSRADSDVQNIWAEEVQKRWDSYKAGKISTVSYEEVMSKHR